MGEFPYTEWLARLYMERGETSGDWVDFLKAHGLANFCANKDPAEARRRLVYDVEEAWYQRTAQSPHPFTFSKHQQLTQSHKSELQEYREETRVDFEDLAAEGQLLETENIFAQGSINRALTFSEKIFALNTKSTNGFINFSKEIITSSINALENVGLESPCDFAVIGLGSVARGEATPYSDLEYAFIVEHASDYFTMLAVDNYFRIGNIGETPLKYFDIQELKTKETVQPALDADMPVGYRIDGITSKSGNIPTGNGKGGQILTLTVQGFMELYRTSAEAPFDGMAGDKSDMLSSSVLMHCNQDASKLYERFLESMKLEIAKAKENDNVIKKRIASFSQDLKEYVFLPEFVKYQPPENLDIKVKTDIFRYPTLLANNIKVCLGLNLTYPWDVYSHLQFAESLTEQNYKYLIIVLALSIYIRSSAYIHQRSQTESALLGSDRAAARENQFRVPANIFLTLGCLLVPIKQSMNSCFFSLTDRQSIEHMINAMAKNLVVDESNFMVQVEVLYFFGDYFAAKRELTKGIGKTIESITYAETLQILQHRYNEVTSETKWVELCSYILYYTRCYGPAITYFEWLITKGQDLTTFWKLLASHCYYAIADYATSRRLLDEVKEVPSDVLTSVRPLLKMKTNHQDTASAYANVGDVFLVLGEYAAAHEYHTKSLEILEILYGVGSSHVAIASSYNMIGNVYNGMGNYASALTYHTKSLEMRKAVHGSDNDHRDIASSYCNLAKVYDNMGDYKKAHDYCCRSLEMRKASAFHYGADIYHLDIATNYDELGSLHSVMGEHAKALECHNKALEMRKAVYEQIGITNHFHIASSYNDIASSYSALGDNKLALGFYTLSLEMSKAVYGPGTNHPDIANGYNNIAKTFNSLGLSKVALDNCTKSIEMLKAIHGVGANHPDIASSYNTIALVQMDMGEYRSARENFILSLEMRKAVHGSEKDHLVIATSYSNIASTSSAMGEFSAAVENYSKSLEMLETVHGSNTNHPLIATVYNNIASAYHNLGNFPLALEHYTKSSAMLNVLYQSDVSHPLIAISYSNMATMCASMGKFAKAIEYYLKAIAILKESKFGPKANYASLATTYNNIASAHSSLCQFETAIEYFTEALEMLKALHGNDTNHPSIATICNNIGCAYNQLHKHTAALQYYKKSLEMHEAVHGKESNHPSIGGIHNNIGSVYSNMGEHKMALEYYIKSLEIAKVKYGSTNHPDISSSYHNIGSAYGRLGDHTLALDYHTKALEMKKAIHGADSNHIDIALSYSHIGCAYRGKGEYTVALEYLDKSVHMSKAVYGGDTNHSAIADILTDIAGVYKDMSNYSTSLEYCTKSLDMRKAVYSAESNHPLIASSYSNIAQLYNLMGEPETGLEYQTKSLEMKQAWQQP